MVTILFTLHLLNGSGLIVMGCSLNNYNVGSCLFYYKKSKVVLKQQVSVGGVTVSIVAFQAIDPGSTPGQRIFFFSYFKLIHKKNIVEYCIPW